MWAKYRQSGFSLVELVIVIVVIAIIATIVLVAYNTVTTNARDAERKAEMGDIKAALKRYFDDNGAYPRCGATGPNSPTYAFSANTAASCLADELVPNYIRAIPVDPNNTG